MKEADGTWRSWLSFVVTLSVSGRSGHSSSVPVRSGMKNIATKANR